MDPIRDKVKVIWIQLGTEVEVGSGSDMDTWEWN